MVVTGFWVVEVLGFFVVVVVSGFFVVVISVTIFGGGAGVVSTSGMLFSK